MSTYYFMICNDCEEITDAASRTTGAHCHLDNSNDTLIPFIISHAYHSVEIISEYDMRLDSWQYRKWTRDNVDDMIDEAKNKGHWK